MGRSRTKARVTTPERAFRSNHQPLQVQTWHIGGLTAEDEGLATGQDHLHAEDMAGGGTLGQTVGPARIVGDIAADRARRLRGRIGGEGQTEWLGFCAQVEIDHAGSDPGGPVLDVDVDLVHRGGGQDDPAVDGYCPGGQPGPCAAGDDRDAVSLRHPDHLGDFLGGLGENDTSRLTLHEGGISRIEIELDRLFEHPILTQHSTQIPDKAHSVEGSCGRLRRYCEPEALRCVFATNSLEFSLGRRANINLRRFVAYLLRGTSGSRLAPSSAAGGEDQEAVAG